MKALEQLKETLKTKFDKSIVKFENPIEDRLFIDIKKEGVRGISKEIVTQGGRYLVSVGYDNTARDNTLGMIHTFAFDRESFFVCVRAAVPESDPALDSITPDIPNAGWSEREYMDLLGMHFPGHPKPKRLVLADDWPEGIHPLRKEVPYNLVPPAAENVAYQMDECPDGCSVVPVGPFHPSLHEPNHWSIFVDGETIKGCDYRGFMTHRESKSSAPRRSATTRSLLSPNESAASAARSTPPPIASALKWPRGLQFPAGPSSYARSCWRSKGFTRICSGSASPATSSVLTRFSCSHGESASTSCGSAKK
jgi:Ni,Fe-hydrogenase III component G